MALKQTLLGVAILIPVLLIVVEYNMSRFKEYQPTLPGITQRHMAFGLEKVKEVAVNTGRFGQTKGHGWAVNFDFYIKFSVYNPAVFSSRLEAMNSLKRRAWNYLFITTEEHVIQILQANLAVGCATSVQIFEKNNIKDSLLKVESMTCSQIESHKLNPKGSFKSGQLKVEMELKKGMEYRLQALEGTKKSGKFNIELNMDLRHYPAQNWVTPLDDDRLTFFISSKRLGMPVYGEYSVLGKHFKCEKEGDCLMGIDIGRGMWNYGASYYWAFAQTMLPNGKLFAFNFQDGIGSEFKNFDKASEDFIVYDQKHYKMDITFMEYSKEDYMKQKVLKTMPDKPYERKVFPERHCELTFTPVHLVEEGINAVVIAFKQYLTYGYFNGFCKTEDDLIQFENLFGHVEHVFNRW